MIEGKILEALSELVGQNFIDYVMKRYEELSEREYELDLMEKAIIEAYRNGDNETQKGLEVLAIAELCKDYERKE